MKETLDTFIKKIPDLNKLTSGNMIPYLAYYLTCNDNCVVSAKTINECFNQLSLIPYSNISSYLGKQSSGKNAIFLKGKTGYTLTRQKREAISATILEDVNAPATNDLIDLSILAGTPFYIKKMAEQMCCCYDANLHDACLVMMRKLFETLIIECYERHSSANEIKDSNGNFYYLSDLIPLLLSSKHWSVSRNLEKHIKLIKKFGDLSAHNRRFFAKKVEIDSFKFELRQCLQELILIIDYENWNKGTPVTQ